MGERIVYVNGAYVPESQASISVFDRGFLFADAVYEVATVLDSQLVDNGAHLARLERSLNALEMAAPATREDIIGIQQELIARNGLREGLVYLQATRGAADRDFAFPARAQPGLVIFTQAKALLDNPAADRGIRIISVPDQRWARRDIKTVNLLGPVLAKQAAKAAGVDDAWMVEDGFVTEGSSNNAFIVTQNDVIITRQLGNEILHGITRQAVMDVTRADRISVEERAFTLEEAYAAKEAFITSASMFVMPVVEIDAKTIGAGTPGPVTNALRSAYIERARSGALASVKG